MTRLLTISILVVVVTLADAYSKYGRTCQDIGCLSNEVCVLKEKTCTTYNRDECGTYPTCEKMSNVVASCEKYVCPPSQICKMDGSRPRCYDNPAVSTNREHKRPVESYQPISPDSENMPNAPVFPSNPNSHYPSNPNYPQQPAINPHYPQQPAINPNYPQQPGQYPGYPNSGVYPQLPPSGRQTTPRPNVYQPGQQYPIGGGGYTGGQVGSGYPGYPMQGANVPPRQGGGYPVQGGGYPVQGAGYPGYPGYTNTGSRYPVGGSGYPSQGGYYPAQGSYGNTGYRQNTGSNSPSFLDKITDSLKTLGTKILNQALNSRL
uniref:Follistatin-like domain-containing protein n=1 Tax=Photinus pyralis TaxID=7054 RepID=A0A1Y1MF18_PHOPY